MRWAPSGVVRGEAPKAETPGRVCEVVCASAGAASEQPAPPVGERGRVFFVLRASWVVLARAGMALVRVGNMYHLY